MRLLLLLILAFGSYVPVANAVTDKPNILIIWGDDVGWNNPSAYHRGMMGYQTPNIDRVANEGALFTDWYGQQSCTAGRAAFITGQFGKNHLGDLDEHLPTNHGFDEFQGNLYHLNAEEEPGHEDYPQSPEFKKKYGPRGVIHSTADGKIEDTGPLNRKRMETIDDEVTAGALDFMDRAVKAKKPFFLWWNSTRMHVFTRLKEESRGVTGLGIYADGMVEHDKHVGQVLDKLDELGITDNTIVMYSTDNGAEAFLWPDGGTSPFRNEKNSNWEGGYRVPTLIRWPGVIKPGTVINEVMSHEDMLPTLLAAVGEPDVKEKLLKGHRANGRDFKVHLDGYNLLPYFKGEVEEGPRKEFFYWSDDGSLTSLRYNRWKMVFTEQRAHGFAVWEEPMVTLRVPKLFDLRGDPYERAEHEAEGYNLWRFERVYLILPAVEYVAKHLETYREYPPRQKPASFNLERVLETLQSNPTTN